MNTEPEKPKPLPELEILPGAVVPTKLDDTAAAMESQIQRERDERRTERFFWVFGTDNVMGFQYAGESSQPLPPDGEWRCFRVDGLSNVQTNADAWHTRDDHSRPNTCVTRIDAQVSR